jgi:hypothetical protein
MNFGQEGIPGADAGVLDALLGDLRGRLHVYAERFNDIDGSAIG